MNIFNEADIKEAIRMVLQEWLDNEHGTLVLQKDIDEYYNRLLNWKAGQDKPLTPELLGDLGAKDYNGGYQLSERLLLYKNSVRDDSDNYDGFSIMVKIGVEFKALVGAPPLRYYQDLQNFYRWLTGEELNVKL